MKKLSLRVKITLWFSAVLILVVALTYFAVLSVSRQVIQKTVKDSLITTVTDNIDEVEYYCDIDFEHISNDVDYYIEYNGGYIEIDDDFLREVNQVYTSLCLSDKSLVYGENPIVSKTSDLELTDYSLRQITIDSTIYYVYDRRLTLKGLEGLWLRGVVSEAQGAVQLSSIVRMSLILLPVLVLLVIIGGYLTAGRTLKPIDRISEAAAQIRQGNDLKRRIDLGEGGDEVHRLADQFNEMFGRLEASFLSQQQFISDASHELRTPVSVIMAQCELTLEQERSPAEYEEALEVIQRQGRKMSRLVKDMMYFTRLELHPERYEKNEINLTEFVEDTCGDLAIIAEKGIELSCDVQRNIYFKGNKGLLTRLLSNLINNAYRYGKDGGFIKVSLKSEENNIILSVKDNGIGIEPSELQNIFRRFYQADPSHTGEGSGLGLAMAREITRFHKGEISAESKLGVGSTFTVTFPKNIL
ncbi:MAG: HAMP domain-containing histidine kinase [Clostridiales bacterium]|nr:HAMP domain-containing histidine kinase [Clostridiales bacterium]